MSTQLAKDITGGEHLEDTDMIYFKKVMESQARAQQLAQSANQAQIEAQGKRNLFYEVVKDKYNLSDADQITQVGQIIRVPIEGKPN